MGGPCAASDCGFANISRVSGIIRQSWKVGDDALCTQHSIQDALCVYAVSVLISRSTPGQFDQFDYHI